MRSDWPEVMIGNLLRGGVIVSVFIVLAGLSITFVHHPEYFSSRPALGQLTQPGAHFPSTIADVVSGVRDGSGEAIAMAGLLLLVATPVARVALSIIIFLIERDRLYVLITTAVLLILVVAFVTGSAG